MNLNLALQLLGATVIVGAGGYMLATGVQSLLFVAVGFLLILLGGHREVTGRVDSEVHDR